MKTYKLVFTSNSIITQIPDSQTLFGAICNIIKETMGSEELLKYLESFDYSPWFVHSSMFFNNILPMVKKNIFSLEFVNNAVKNAENKDQLTVLNELKKYKKIHYVSEKIYNEFIAVSEVDSLKTELLSNKSNFKIINEILMKNDENISIESKTVLQTRNGFPIEGSNDRTLFYSKQMYCDKKTEFCVFVKTDKEIAVLQKIFSFLEYFGIGSRKSVGFNSFKLIRIEECNLKSDLNMKMILSKYIPNKEFICENSYYQSESNIYTGMNDKTHIKVGKFVHILEGSFMYMTENKEYYGKVIKTVHNDKNLYHYGIGFVF